ncbi:hypothetical protein WJX75_004731 [Coccomyxa subellipsoidea]|uniref:DUF143-domain-containing protein n=1 Tax=Coccomyxa subellipsoidea TaxID=248742 RepID=A0ABR2YZU9_9CHLO
MQGSRSQCAQSELVSAHSRNVRLHPSPFVPHKPSAGAVRSLENTLILRREQNSSEADERASTSSDATTSGTDGEELAVELAKIANDVKGEEISVLHVAPLVYWTSYLVLVTVNSRPQLQAVIARMERRAKELDRESSFVSRGRSAWEVLDFGDVVVHIFTPDQRDYYDLESFYGAAEEIPLPFLTEQRTSPDWASQLR